MVLAGHVASKTASIAGVALPVTVTPGAPEDLPITVTR